MHEARGSGREGGCMRQGVCLLGEGEGARGHAWVEGGQGICFLGEGEGVRGHAWVEEGQGVEREVRGGCVR